MLLIPKFFFILFFIFLISGTSHAYILEGNIKIGKSFGVQLKHDRTTEEDLKRIKAAGFGFVRLDMRWASVEKKRKIFDWSSYDEFFSRLEKHDLGAMVVLFRGNELYSGSVAVDPKIFWGLTEWAPAPTNKQDRQAFAHFAQRAAERFSNYDIIWEIWNEPDWGGFWAPSPDPKAYAELASVTCTTIRKKVPNATIIGPALSMLPMAKPPKNTFIKEFLISSALECFNAISLHTYRHKDQVPESVIKDLRQSIKYMENNLPEGMAMPPLINSEWGYSTLYVSKKMQADYVLRSHLSGLLGGLKMSVWYEWRNSFDDDPKNKEAHFGLVTSNRATKPSFNTIHNILPKIKDAYIKRKIDTGDEDVFAIVLEYPNGLKALLTWSATKFNKDIVATLTWPSHQKMIPITTMPTLTKFNGTVPLVSLSSR